jgi:hypothetical protein
LCAVIWRRRMKRYPAVSRTALMAFRVALRAGRSVKESMA